MKATILIVEDEGLIALHISEVLAKAGCVSPDPVPSGEAALDYLMHGTLPDLVLMDIGLAGKMDGIETARRIQKLFTIPIIFLTAYSDQNRIDEARGIGQAGYLVKPVVTEELLAEIERVLGNRDGPV